jgi:hypothetical protein
MSTMVNPVPVAERVFGKPEIFWITYGIQNWILYGILYGINKIKSPLIIINQSYPR